MESFVFVAQFFLFLGGRKKEIKKRKTAVV
jgi:hypothetical protein